MVIVTDYGQWEVLEASYSVHTSAAILLTRLNSVPQDAHF